MNSMVQVTIVNIKTNKENINKENKINRDMNRTVYSLDLPLVQIKVGYFDRTLITSSLGL
jgi:hypothetical protein